MVLALVRRIAGIGICLLLYQGCAFFAGKPALPKHASIEELQKPATPTDFSAVVESADLIYFPRDRVTSGVRSEPAALLREALEKTGRPFVIGWDLIDAAQQPLLDEISTQIGAAREESIGKLDLVGSGRAREHCRAALREPGPAGIKHLALRCPALLLRKVAASEPFAAEERELLPRGYKRPRGGMEGYAERMANPNPADPALIRLYRTELVRQQFAADRIVSHLRGSPDGTKALLFLAETDLSTDEAVPYYVAQKLRVRQLVLGSDAPQKERAKLLTNRRSRRALEIVDRAPIASGE